MPPSLNILYLVQRAYDVFSRPPSGQPSFAAAEPALFLIVQYLEWVAIIGSVVFLIVFIWIRLRLEGVEHALHHERHEAELEFAGAHRAHGEHPRWEQMLSLVHSSNESDWRRAIIEADIMLGEALENRGYIGEDIGERLKSVNSAQVPSVEAAWEAHRLRNAVAHLGEGFVLTHRDVLAAVDGYRRIFEELNYI